MESGETPNPSADDGRRHAFAPLDWKTLGGSTVTTDWCGAVVDGPGPIPSADVCGMVADDPVHASAAAPVLEGEHPPVACDGLVGGCGYCITLYLAITGQDMRGEPPYCAACDSAHWPWRPHGPLTADEQLRAAGFPVVDVDPAAAAEHVEAFLRHSARLREQESGRDDAAARCIRSGCRGFGQRVGVGRFRCPPEHANVLPMGPVT